MAELYLDIRDRIVRAIVSDGTHTILQRIYTPETVDVQVHKGHGDHQKSVLLWRAGELAPILGCIRTDAGVRIDHAHLIIPTADVIFSTHKLVRMPESDAMKLVIRKNIQETKEEDPQVRLIPMGGDAKNQFWFAEYIPTDVLKAYLREFSSSKIKLRTVSTVFDSLMQSFAPIRESIFNAHAVFEINDHAVGAYYISSAGLLLQEHLEVEHDEIKGTLEHDRDLMRQMFKVLSMLYSINGKYMAENQMTPVQKGWVFGTHPVIKECAEALKDAMDVEVAVIGGFTGETPENSAYLPLSGFIRALQEGTAVNFMHPDILRRFPLRKKSGMIIYITTLIVAILFVFSTEIRHMRIKNELNNQKKSVAAQKANKTESAAFAKNIEQMKLLVDGQTLFYPLFQELANKLPDNTSLESMEYRLQDNRNLLDLTISSRITSDFGSKHLLSALLGVIDTSSTLKRIQEPTITIASQGAEKAVTVKISCEVIRRDSKK